MSIMRLLMNLFLLNLIIAQVNAQLPPTFPDILIQLNGNLVKTYNDWENNRRNEILQLFEKLVYGKMPADFHPFIEFTNLEENRLALEGLAIRKQVKIRITNPKNGKALNALLLMYLPAKTNGPVPVFLGMNFDGNQTIHKDPGIIISDSWIRNNNEKKIFNNKGDESTRGIACNRWPLEYILSRGYGLATMLCGDFDPDFDDGFKNGLHSLFFEGESDYPSDGAGTIAAWAFGLSKAMDYLETDPEVDAKKVIVIGHSRLGKAALWAVALDNRFGMAISNNSGCGGAALSMRKHGETVKAINDRFPHWFCANFKNFNDHEENLPVDQHMLLALICPRPVYVASAEEDDWADPYGEQLSVWLSTEVYRLYNLETHLSEKPAIVNFPVKSGYAGYHIRNGSHNITAYDWEQYLDYADYYFLMKEAAK